jgi:SAM-dependent methyltransferase
LINSHGSRTRYPFDNAAPQARTRLSSLAAIYDGVTFRHLDRFGIPEGACCLEVGAGAGSVAAFMKERAGPDSQVIATDINTDQMVDTLSADIDVRRHDIGVDPLPDAVFDVIHARAVLTFVLQRRAAVARMASALKPGGWILIEEMVPPITEALSRSDDPDIQLAHKARQAIVEVICRNGGDTTFAREIPRILGESGIGDIGVEGFFLPFRTDAVADLTKANIDQLSASLIESGLLSPAELCRYRMLLDVPELFYPASMALISVWGRRELA